jgi:hypothetical protein
MATAGAGGYILAVDAEIRVCLIVQDKTGGAPYGPKPDCSPVVYGEQFPHQLYAAVGEKCYSEDVYTADGGFKPLPDAKELHVETGAWECGEGVGVATGNLLWTIAETIESGNSEEG